MQIGKKVGALILLIMLSTSFPPSSVGEGEGGGVGRDAQENSKRLASTMEGSRRPRAASGAIFPAPKSPSLRADDENFSLGRSSPRPLRQAGEIKLTSDLEANYLTDLKMGIKQLDGFEEEKAALETLEVKIGSIKGLGQTTYAEYFPGKIVINRKVVEETLSELVSLGTFSDEGGPQRAAKSLAVQFLVTMVHELRHAVNDRALPGMKYVMEDEIDAYTVQCLAYAQISKKYPEISGFATKLSVRDYATAQRWAMEGWGGLRLSVAHSYKGIDSLSEFLKKVKNPGYGCGRYWILEPVCRWRRQRAYDRLSQDQKETMRLQAIAATQHYKNERERLEKLRCAAYPDQCPGENKECQNKGGLPCKK